VGRQDVSDNSSQLVPIANGEDAAGLY